MLRPVLAAALATAALLGSAAAQAGTHWSIGINVPLPAVVVADPPRYYEPAPVYYAPPPVVYAPPPRYVVRETYYAPPPRVVYETAWRERRWDERHDEGRWRREHHRREHWDRDDYGPYRGR